MTAGKPGEDDKETVREAALYDPDSVFRDYPLESTAARVFQSLIAPPPASAPEPAAGGETLYAPGEKKRAGGALTKEMIKRIADRAEQAAAAKKAR